MFSLIFVGNVMAIPEAQLETWSHQGSVTQSSSTYASIKNMLEEARYHILS